MNETTGPGIATAVDGITIKANSIDEKPLEQEETATNNSHTAPSQPQNNAQPQYSDSSKDLPPKLPKSQKPPEFSFSDWFKNNNPLYLLSVLFMLLGLHLVSSDAQASNLSVNGLLAFFAIQNIYEILMVGMALYLLKSKIQPGHGKLLLLFVLLFLGDVTFYQVRISGLSVALGNLATLVYMVLACIKLAAVIKALNLKIYHWRIFYVLSSFSLIWIGPKITYNLMDSIGKSVSSYFNATTIIYLIWLTAGLIHLPIIIKHWFSNQLNEPEENSFIGNETTFWRYLMVFPFIIMPVQLLLNVMADSSLSISSSTPSVTLIVPWFIMAGFFAQTMWKRSISKIIKINLFDSILLGFATLVTMVTLDAELTPVIINFTIAISALLITVITRKNTQNAAILGFVGLYFSGTQFYSAAKSAVNYSKGLSKTAWAGILMAGSFVTLGLGFLLSIGKKTDNVE